MHGVSRSEQRSLCHALHFLLAVLSAHCCAFSKFFFIRADITSFLVEAAELIHSMVTLTIRNTVCVCDVCLCSMYF